MKLVKFKINRESFDFVTSKKLRFDRVDASCIWQKYEPSREVSDYRVLIAVDTFCPGLISPDLIAKKSVFCPKRSTFIQNSTVLAAGWEVTRPRLKSWSLDKICRPFQETTSGSEVVALTLSYYMHGSHDNVRELRFQILAATGVTTFNINRMLPDYPFTCITVQHHSSNRVEIV